MKAHSRWLVIGLMPLALSPLQGQEARGTLLGRVTDATGSIIIRAKVVESRGFKTYRRAGIVVRESDRVTIDMAMEIGEASQSVQVNAETPLLDTSTASMGMVVERRAITDLPSKDGMVLIMATLTPGVTFTPQTAAYVRPFDTSSPSTMSVNGTRSGSNEFMVDGASNMQGTQIAYSPPQTVIEQFKVQTATFDASFGFMPGAAMNMTLKSGLPDAKPEAQCR